MKSWALSIRGGGTRSVAYAGFLQALDDARIKPNLIIGASGGAVVGVSYAFGVSPARIYQHFVDFDPYSFINFRSLLSEGHLMDYEKWLEHARVLVDKNADLRDAKIPVLVQATNLNTAQLDYLSEGNATRAVIASSAVLEPYEFHRKKYLDGDIDPEFGADEARAHGINFVVGLKIKAMRHSPSKDLIAKLVTPFRIAQENALRGDLLTHPVDVLVQVRSDSELMFSKRGLNKLYQNGLKAGREFLSQYGEKLA